MLLNCVHFYIFKNKRENPCQKESPVEVLSVEFTTGKDFTSFQTNERSL